MTSPRIGGLFLGAGIALGAGCGSAPPAPAPSHVSSAPGADAAARPGPGEPAAPAHLSPPPTAAPGASPGVAPAPTRAPASPAPTGPAAVGGRPEGASVRSDDEARRAVERGRTELLVDLIVRAKSYERGFEAALLFLPEMPRPVTQALIQRSADADSRARERSLEALGDMARLRLLPEDLRPRAVETVSLRVRSETSHAAWAAAVRALGSLAGVAAGKEITDALVRAVDDDAWSVVRACAEVVGELPYKPAAPALVQAADKVRDRYAFRAILRALGEAGGPEASERLRAALVSTDVGDREAAASALGDAGGQSAARALGSAILKRDEDPQVRRAALAALERLGGDEARKALEGCLLELRGRTEDAWLITARDVTETLERLRSAGK